MQLRLITIQTMMKLKNGNKPAWHTIQPRLLPWRYFRPP
jgi:hypothetical protein